MVRTKIAVYFIDKTEENNKTDYWKKKGVCQMNKKPNTMTWQNGVRALVVGVCVAAALTAITPAVNAAEKMPTAKPESVGISSERLARIDEYFQRFIDDNQIAGAVTLVARHGKVVHHSAVG